MLLVGILHDYIKFISNLEYYLNLDLKFIQASESKYYNYFKENNNIPNHPIGLLDDVELMMLHYRSEKEAYEKWTKRCKRVNMNKLIVKFNNQNGCKYEHIIKFDNVNIKNKIFFSTEVHDGVQSEIYIKHCKKEKSIPASLEPFVKSKYININKLINDL